MYISALIHVHQVDLLGESIHTTRQNREALLVTSGEIGLGVPSTYTGCHRRNGPNFGRVFLTLNYTDITQNTYVPS